MVRIIDLKVRQSRDGEPFIALIVQGGIELIQSKSTGLFYATSKKASIPSTFDEATAKSFLGAELPGSVQKVECEPYTFTNEETGEVIELDFRWVYVKEGETVAQAAKVFQHEEEPELV